MNIIVLSQVSQVRRKAEDVMQDFNYNLEKARNKVKQCTCCGYYFQIEDGAGEFDHKDKTHFDICNDCIDLLKAGVDFSEIPYVNDELEDFVDEEE